MSWVQLAGYDVLWAHVVLTLEGTWRAHLAVDAEDDAVGLSNGTHAALSLGGAVTWPGTIFRQLPEFGRRGVLLLGGQGGLAAPATGQSYVSPQASHVVADLLAIAGETLSPSVLPQTLAVSLPAWSRVAGTVSANLDLLAEALGLAWRVLTDGTVWFGVDTYPATTLSEYDVLARDGVGGRVTLGTDTPWLLLPGQTLDGQQVYQVETEITASRVRVEAWVLP